MKFKSKDEYQPVGAVNIVSALNNRISELESKLCEKLQVLDLLSHAIKLAKEQEAQKTDSSLIFNQLREKVTKDDDLGYPHSKIMERLMSEFDYSSRQFGEVNFSQLVKDSHIGKNMANQYLAALENKGLVEKRDDGYRKHFKIRDKQ